MMRQAVAQDLVQQIDREQRSIPLHRLPAPWRASGPADRIRVALQPDDSPPGVARQGPWIAPVGVTADDQTASRSPQPQEQVEDAAGGPGVATPHGAFRTGDQPLPLRRRAPSGTVMGRRVESVNEPGERADRGADTERVILGVLEGLEVVEDHRFVETLLEVLQGASLEQNGMPPEPGADPGDGVGSTVQRPGDLPQRRAGDQPGGDGEQQSGPLAVVGDGEGLAGKGPTAGAAAESRDAPALRCREEPVAAEAVSGLSPTVLGAGRPGAERRLKACPVLDGSLRPVHGDSAFQVSCRSARRQNCWQQRD